MCSFHCTNGWCTQTSNKKSFCTRSHFCGYGYHMPRNLTFTINFTSTLTAQLLLLLYFTKNQLNTFSQIYILNTAHIKLFCCNAVKKSVKYYSRNNLLSCTKCMILLKLTSNVSSRFPPLNYNF